MTKSIVIVRDCLELMAEYPDNHFDLAVVDPPYGLPKSATCGAGKMGKRIFNTGNITTWDIAPPEEYFTELFRVSKNQIIWGGNHFNLPPTRGFIVWDKQQPFPNFAATEYAWTSFQCPSKIFRLASTRTREKKIHPTQKPVSLYSFIYKEFLKEGGKVLDTHLGSGSNRIAAEKAGNIDFLACDISQAYIDLQEKRYQEHMSQLSMCL
jgi:site-specific DNA-methyltransferase (adenine-specific)